MYAQTLSLRGAPSSDIHESRSERSCRNASWVMEQRRYRMLFRTSVAWLPAVATVVFLGDSGTTFAMQPTPKKVWTDEELYEARNWMPNASDVQSGDPQFRSTRPRVSSTYPTSRYRVRRKVQRLNLAEYKARLAAKIGIRRLVKPGRPANSTAPVGLRHVGGHLGMGGGNLEGAGYSARSPYEALAACSYSQYGYPVLYQGVAKGRDGYFAYKIYRR